MDFILKVHNPVTSSSSSLNVSGLVKAKKTRQPVFCKVGSSPFCHPSRSGYFLGWHKGVEAPPATHFVTQVLRRTKQIKLPQGPAIHMAGQGSSLCCQHPPRATRGPQLLLHAGKGASGPRKVVDGSPSLCQGSRAGGAAGIRRPLPAFLGTAQLWRLYLSAWIWPTWKICAWTPQNLWPGTSLPQENSQLNCDSQSHGGAQTHSGHSRVTAASPNGEKHGAVTRPDDPPPPLVQRISASRIDSQRGPHPCIHLRPTHPVSLIKDKTLCKNNLTAITGKGECGLHGEPPHLHSSQDPTQPRLSGMCPNPPSPHPSTSACALRNHHAVLRTIPGHTSLSTRSST